LGYATYDVSSSLRTILDGGLKIEGVVESIDDIYGVNRRTKKQVLTGHRVYVRFTTPAGKNLVKPVQHDLENLNSTFIDEYTNTQVYYVGKTVPVIYNERLGDRIFINDFFELWVFPGFLGILTILSIIVPIILIFISIKYDKKK
jgi:hypothetical protein